MYFSVFSTFFFLFSLVFVAATFFFTIKNMDMMNYIILKYFYRKPEEILSFLMILDENPNFPPKFVKNLHIQNFN